MKERLSRTMLLDGGVIVVIIVVAMGYLWFSSTKLPGWDIKDKTVALENEQKTVESNVYVRGGGKLSLNNSDLTLASTFDDEFSLYIEGDSVLDLENATIKGDEYRYGISASQEDDKSPVITVTGSTFSDHTGIRLYNRTTFDATDASIGLLHVRDSAQVDLTRTAVFPVLYPQKTMMLDNLKAAEHVTQTIMLSSGWSLGLDDCTVEGYQFELFDEYALSLSNSSEIILSLHSSGDLEDPVSLDVSYAGSQAPTTGSIDSFGISVSWTNTRIDGVSLAVTGTDDVTLKGGTVDSVRSSGSAVARVSDATVRCSLCTSYESSTIEFSHVVVPEVPLGVQPEARSPILILHGLSTLTVSNSDIRNLHVILLEGSSVSIDSSQFNEAFIINKGRGNVVVDGIKRATLDDGSISSEPAYMGKIIMVVAPENYRDEELDVPRQAFLDAGYEVVVASLGVATAKSMSGATVAVDRDLSKDTVGEYDGIVFVGGSGASVYFNDEIVLDLARSAVEQQKIVGAICYAPSILANAGVLESVRATAFSSQQENLADKGATVVTDGVVVDGNIVTADGPANAEAFAQELLTLLRK